MTDFQKIQEIHSSNMYGVVVEAGAGCSITQTLCRYKGSSKTLHYSFSPYSREIQSLNYPGEQRSVSKEQVQKMVLHTKDQIHSKAFESYHKKVNFILVFSGQVSPLPHGWYGLWYEGKEYYYHVTLTRSPTQRSWIMDDFGKIGMEILYAALVDEFTTDLPLKIDLAYINDKICWDELIRSTDETIVTINPNGELIRFEDEFRGFESKVFYKGSFNPVHDGHISVFRESLKRVGGKKGAFVISLENFEKEKNVTNLADLKNRIARINAKGFYCCIIQAKDFYRTYQRIKERVGENFVLPVGEDTYVRISQYDRNLLKDHILKFERTDVSSTNIRKEKCECGKDYINCKKFLDGQPCKHPSSYRI